MAVTDGLGDLYALLGVGPEASDDDIKRAYRARARELHPDTNHGDPAAEARFKEVTVAYEVLRDPEKRARYDRYGPEGVFGSQAGGGMGGFGFEGGLGDIFEAFFGQMGGTSARRRGPQVGADAEVRLGLEFAEAVFGARKDITVRLPAMCATCNGAGTAAGTEAVACTDCQGTGELRRVRQSLLGQVVTSVACSRCSGTGEMIPNPCAECRGEGRRMEESTFTVEVPAGVEEGSTLRLADRGAAGQRGGPNGSLFVHLVVNPDPRFERQADNLHTTLTVSIAQAALGIETDVETLDGPQRLALGPGTQHGHIERIRGLGVPHLRGRGRGDFYVHVLVATPTDLTPEQDELLRQFAAARGEEVAAPGSGGGEGVFSRLRSAFG
jgi:molecular chaperone DnaJ